MDRVEQSVNNFLNGYNCAQSIVACYAPLFGVSAEQAEGFSGGFGAGIGGLRHDCGAFTGMVMILGLARGYDKTNPKDKSAFYAEIRALSVEFIARTGALDCATLLHNASVKVQADPTLRNTEYYKGRPCANFVRVAAEILEEKVVGR